MASDSESLKWWQKAVFYQVYPQSFSDGNQDGTGDLPGLIDRLDYLRDLGIDAIWLSPHFPSPMFDCGYDISDYSNVAPEYGDLETFQFFLDRAHRHGIRVILDLVLNHTSHQHAWFLESRSSRDNPKRNWYIWKDGVNGGPPNNWSSCFDGPAWEWDERTGQYYYHYFFKEQPDLNWRNPEVKQAMFAAVRFWLDRGVDGFRLDAIGTIYENEAFPNHPVPYNLVQLRQLSQAAATGEEKQRVGKMWQDTFAQQLGQPGLHPLMRELRQVLDAYAGDRMLVAEDEDIAYHGNGQDELDLVFNFPLMHGEPGTGRLTPAHIRQNQRQRLAALDAVPHPAWPCNTLGNHDSSRVWTRYGDGIHNALQARLSLALMLTLRGTPFLYNGEEIGMADMFLTDIAQFRDRMGAWYYYTVIQELKVPHQEALLQAGQMTRDKNRTPMQWQNAPNAGFSPASVKTWLPVNPNYAQGINVADQLADPQSLLHFYRRLLDLRRKTPALVAGDYRPLHPKTRKALVFLRHSSHPDQTCLVALNFSDQPYRLEWGRSLPGCSLQVLFASAGKLPEQILPNRPSLRLAPFEILIARVEPTG